MASEIENLSVDEKKLLTVIFYELIKLSFPGASLKSYFLGAAKRYIL